MDLNNTFAIKTFQIKRQIEYSVWIEMHSFEIAIELNGRHQVPLMVGHFTK